MTLQTFIASLQNLTETLPTALGSGDPSAAAVPKQSRAGGAQTTRTSWDSNQRIGETNTTEPSTSFLPPPTTTAQPQRYLRAGSLPGPQGSHLKVCGPCPTRHHRGQLLLAQPRRGLSRYQPDSQRVINPSCTPNSEMADSLRRHSGRDELISLSEALPLSSCWDWIYEHLAFHPRQ